jgi:hypothetical protein
MFSLCCRYLTVLPSHRYDLCAKYVFAVEDYVSLCVCAVCYAVSDVDGEVLWQLWYYVLHLAYETKYCDRGREDLEVLTD